MHEWIAEDHLVFRLMEDSAADYSLMASWLTDPRVLAYYEGRDNPFPLERIKESYSPRNLQHDGTTPCLVFFQKRAIGYLQFCPVDAAERQAYGMPAESDAPGFYGLDQFIGEVGYWNRGIGTRIVSLVLRYLFSIKHARKVLVDPQVTNARAIRCYEKAGFRKVTLLPKHALHEGQYRDSWLMEAMPEVLDP